MRAAILLTVSRHQEGSEMLRRKGSISSARCGVVAATIAVLVLTMAEPPMAAASSAGPISTGVSATTPSGGDTDFSARRRRHYRRGNAAGLAIMGAMIGTIGGAIAAQQRRDEYYDYYGPRYYGPGYYGSGPYYGRRYYRYYPY
jgi:hypothetical protein